MLSYSYTAIRKSDGFEIHTGTADRSEDQTSSDLLAAIRSEVRQIRSMATALSDEQIDIKMCLRV